MESEPDRPLHVGDRTVEPRRRGGVAAYYDFNTVGSTVGITGPPGTYVNAYSYLPFGETLKSPNPVANPFMYVGQTGTITGPAQS